MPLTLLIPELVWSNPDDRETFAAIDARKAAGHLAGRQAGRQPAAAVDQVLAALAGYGDDAPLAALRLAGDTAGEMDAAARQEPGEDYWLCADPVHLRFHQELLLLADNSEIGLDDEESDALVASLNRELAPACFHRTSADRWYVALGENPGPGSLPLSAVAGRSLATHHWTGTPAVRRLANEAQMILHHHPVNERRQLQGRPTANALWFWGGGRMPTTPPARPFSTVVGDSPLLRGIAFRAGIPARPLATTFAETAAGPNTLVVWDGLQLPAQRQDATAFAAAWSRLDDAWLSPALAALRRGRLRGLRIVAPTAYGVLNWQLAPLDLWRPRWQRPRLAALAANLARLPQP